MPYSIDFLEDEQIVVVENIGKLTYEDFVKETQKALDLGGMKNTRLFLADNTRLITEVGFLDLYDFPAMYEKIGAPKSSKVAVLLPEDAATRKDVEFYETVCRNRGWIVRVFGARDAAVEWLLR